MSHCKMEYKYKLRKWARTLKEMQVRSSLLLNCGCLIALIDVYCRMNFRVPPTSNYVQMAAAGRATGVWDRREHTFYFQMPPGITKALMEFSGILGHYQSDFDMAQCAGSFVGWGEYDYDYESERFQMEREFSRCYRTRPRITNHPFRRLNHRLESYNPARPWTMPGTKAPPPFPPS